MAEESLIEGEDENILYDLLVINEWPAETDTQLRGNKEHKHISYCQSSDSPSSSCLPLGLVRLAHKQINWQLVLASNGKLLAVVQDQCVEIRSVRDDFGSIIGKCQVGEFPRGFQLCSGRPDLLSTKAAPIGRPSCSLSPTGAGSRVTWSELLRVRASRVNRVRRFISPPPPPPYPSSFPLFLFGPTILRSCPQPGFDEINPEWKTSLERRKKIKDKEQYYPLEDVSWWSDVVLILVRCSGSVTVSSVRTLRNLLGKSCEWFEPSPRVTAAHEVVFLSLEVESLEVERTDEAMQL
ncbi:hypothetical protein F7725_019498 [Dissostichus mawsoni]|uniref:Neuroblastoma-amplified sequence N-terminal domain-containing protein n=1 Tax=Dissostichus mawsoni TaxID=36200 RepID=A0A7J5YLZ1_DISMA|nr:hypothetical protein F7725_019498 [Dissostichus mawsoni]